MKERFYLILLSICISLNCLIVSGNESVSLYDASDKALIGDTAHVKSLFTAGNQFLDGPSDSLLHYYGKALDVIRLNLIDGEKTGNVSPELRKEFEKLEIRALITLGIEYFYRSNYIKALNYYYEALEKAEMLNDSETVSECYSEIAIVYKNQGRYEEAISYNQKALDLALLDDDEFWVAACYTNHGTIYLKMGYYTIALDNYLKALPIFERLKEMRGIIATYQNIGKIYYHQLEYYKALDYFNKALDLSILEENRVTELSSRLAIGKTYADMGKYDSSLFHLHESLSLYRELGYKHELDDCYKSLGSVYLKMHNYAKASQYSEDAYEISELEEDMPGMTDAMILLAEISVARNDIAKAGSYLLKALTLAEQLNSLNARKDGYNLLINILRKQGRYDSAFMVQQKLNQVNDSIFSSEKYRALTELQVKYESEKREQQVALLTEKNEVQQLKLNRRNRLYILSGIGVLLTILIGYLLYRQSQMQSKHKELELEQRLFRAQMNPHFIFNSLIAIQSYIYKKDPVTAGDYLAKFADLVRMILENSRVEFVSLLKEITTLGYYLELQALRFEGLFEYQLDVDELIDKESVMIPPMFAQPFIENAIEHGLRHKNDKGVLKVQYTQHENYILCQVEDNGIGREKAGGLKKNKNHKSLATSIIQERLAALSKKYKRNFSLTIEDLRKEDGSPEGTKILLRIPFIA